MPVHSEQNHLATVIKSMPGLVDVIFVIDEKSSDKTFDVALSAADSRTEVIQHEVN